MSRGKSPTLRFTYVSKVIWQKAALLTPHSSRLRIDSSDLDLHLIHGSLDPRQSAPPQNGISIGFAQQIRVTNTDTQTTLRATSAVSQ